MYKSTNILTFWPNRTGSFRNLLISLYTLEVGDEPTYKKPQPALPNWLRFHTENSPKPIRVDWTKFGPIPTWLGPYQRKDFRVVDEPSHLGSVSMGALSCLYGSLEWLMEYTQVLPYILLLLVGASILALLLSKSVKLSKDFYI